jgi:hypothetical protein
MTRYTFIGMILILEACTDAAGLADAGPQQTDDPGTSHQGRYDNLQSIESRFFVASDMPWSAVCPQGDHASVVGISRMEGRSTVPIFLDRVERGACVYPDDSHDLPDVLLGGEIYSIVITAVSPAKPTNSWVTVLTSCTECVIWLSE